MENANPTDLLVGDLGRRISDLTVEATSWKVRAILAEQRVEELESQDVEKEDGVG